MTRADARFEAERARVNANRAGELHEVRVKAHGAAVLLGKPEAELAITLEGARMAEREQRFWAAQAVRYAEIAGDPVAA